MAVGLWIAATPLSSAGAPCMGEAFGGVLSCSANDVSVLEIRVESVADGCTGAPGDTLTVAGHVIATTSGTLRYDVGVYLGSDPVNSVSDDCTVTIVDPSVTDRDFDACGEMEQGVEYALPFESAILPCTDRDADGYLDVAVGTTWSRTSDGLCMGPEDAVPATPTQCTKGVATTQFPLLCGNGVADENEECDDGNLNDNDGCSVACFAEQGWDCSSGACEPICGDGSTVDNEGCDDGNATSGDGCDANCTATACGNGVVTEGEECDDGNTTSGDGCDANCIATACGNGVLDSNEACEPTSEKTGGCCGNDCQFLALGTVCRPSAGVCDVAETCTGSSPACPPDGFATGNLCRATAGVCDVAETCAGSSPACPPDGFASGTLCRATAGVCDVAETCTGSSPVCPANFFASNKTCRPSASVCDAVESCTGSSALCQPDAFAAGTTCRASSGACDAPETCTGSSISCPGNGFFDNGTICDDGLFCTDSDACSSGACIGTARDCSDGDACTADSCNEASDLCVHAAIQNCTADCGNGKTDQGEDCDGGPCCTAGCTFRPAGTTCRAPAGVCDAAEKCTGTSPTCRANGFLSSLILCRAAIDTACDVPEQCPGNSPACPADARNDGQSCEAGPVDSWEDECRAGQCSKLLAEGAPCQQSSDCSERNAASLTCGAESSYCHTETGLCVSTPLDPYECLERRTGTPQQLAEICDATDAVPSCTCGDADSNGNTTAGDALAALRRSVGSLAQCPLCACDVNGSGAINASDALTILKVSVGSGPSIGCGVCFHCLNGELDDVEQNPAETDTDCGGECLPCGNGRECLVDSDCASELCCAGVCSESCSIAAQ